LYGKFCTYSIVTLGLVLAIPSFGDVVPVATTDDETIAGAVDLSGDTSPSIDITGSLASSSITEQVYGVVVFKIDILNPLNFSAETVDAGPHGLADTALFLFDSSGNGVYMNDDKSGGDTLSCLPSSMALSTPADCPVSSTTLGPQSAGIYYLAISASSNYPIDALSNEIFSPSSSTDVVGPNSLVGPLGGWDGGAFASPDFDNVNYSIELSDAPEPASWPVVAGLGLAIILVQRRLRLRTR